MQSGASQSPTLHLCAVLTPALHLPREPNHGTLPTLPPSFPPSASSITFAAPTHIHEPRPLCALLLISHHHPSFSTLIHAEPYCAHPMHPSSLRPQPVNDCSPARSCFAFLDCSVIQLLFFPGCPSVLPQGDLLLFEAQSSPAH